MNDIVRTKQELRQLLFNKRQALPDKLRQTYAANIHQHVLDFLNTKHVDQLLTYKALAFEVNTDMILTSQAYEIYVPRMLPETDMQWVRVEKNTIWQEADFGVLEPADGEIWQPSALKTVLLCPLLGYDKQGYRLGMGKGYFDRWLDKFGQQVEVVGLGYSCQELPRVPIEPHDVPLSSIITEQGSFHVE